MPGGVFQTDRVIFDSPIWKNPAKFRLFFYIYGNAVFSKDGLDIGGIHLERGQLLKSYRNLSDELEYLENHSLKKYSISHIKKMIDELVDEKRIQMEISPLGTVFTVLNYEQYQGFERFEKDNREQSENTERTLKERRKNNNNKDKKVKNEKELNINTELKNENEIENSDNNKIELLNQGVFPEYLSYVVWNEFVLMRKNVLKCPLTPFGEKLVLAKAERFHNEGYDVNELFELAIVGCWKSIFVPDKLKKGAKSELTDSQEALLRSFSRAD